MTENVNVMRKMMPSSLSQFPVDVLFELFNAAELVLDFVTLYTFSGTSPLSTPLTKRNSR